MIAAAVATAVALFPSWLRDTSPVETRHYADWSVAPTSQDDAAAARPSWAPADATDIDLSYRVRNVPGWDVAMTSEQGLDPSSCTRVTTGGRTFALGADFMPPVFPRQAWTCGDGRIVWQDGDHVYGATPDVPVER